MAAVRASHPSPFLHCGPTTEAGDLAVLHLKRDLLIPTLLRSQDEKNEGYDEGKVTNTRFGSFPHSTLIGVPWGSQVRASAVDTGSRGRKGWERSRKKRKRGDLDEQGNAGAEGANGEGVKPPENQKAAVEAASGFVHLLPPTPESWTASLPHRTQVVYTPDYSYILHRIRARPGIRLIEAGAGSGSFTHAAARAVFNGYPIDEDANARAANSPAYEGRPKCRGKVWSFEFHEQRAQALKQELHDHGLDGVVELTYRDVCQDGFTPEVTGPSEMKVNAVFLDLPAPWLALKYLSRQETSPLDPQSAVHLCTFSPCIEQVQRTMASLRQLGWVEIEMVEIAAKRIEVRRERVGLQEEGLRGVNDNPATVDEALTRLREVEGRTKLFHEESGKTPVDVSMVASPLPAPPISKQQRLQTIKDAQEGRKLYKEGRLVTKAELELKTHTSYLVFAILPRDWTEEDERKAQAQYSSPVIASDEPLAPISQRQKKRAAKAEAGVNKGVELERERAR